MYKSLLLIILLTTFTGSRPLLADEILTVSPKKCVALRKGQTCYQKLRLRFRTSLRDDYCLFSSTQNKPLNCFTAVNQGEWFHPLASENGVEFTLVNSESATVARTQVVIAWVYRKTRKRNRWRLF